MHRMLILAFMSTTFYLRQTLAYHVSTAALFLLLLIQSAVAGAGPLTQPSRCQTSFSGSGWVSVGDAGRFAVLVEDSPFCTPATGIIVDNKETRTDGSLGSARVPTVAPGKGR